MAKTESDDLLKSRVVETDDGPMNVVVHSFSKIDKPLSTNIESNQLDPFNQDYADEILSPPYSLQLLSELASQYSAPLKQCIEVTKTNVVGHGWDLAPSPWWSAQHGDPPAEAVEERQRLMRLFKYPNRHDSLVRLMRQVTQDEEEMAIGYLEVVRNRAGEIDTLLHLPSYSMRWTKRDKKATPFEQTIVTEDGKIDHIQRKERFRRYVQRIDGIKKVYFKEVGDPRKISAKTGEEIATGPLANEVIVFSLEPSSTTYPLPRWFPNVIGILGSHEADTVNHLYFGNKGIPPLVVTVSGGSLAKKSLDRIADGFKKEIQGVTNFEKILILEATPASVSLVEGEKISPVRIEVKPLTEAIKDDARFLKYREAVAKSIYSDYRFPPVLLGKSDDYNRATVVEAVRVAEEQVFEPQRKEMEHTIAITILADMEIKYWTLEFLGGKTSDFAAMLEAIGTVKEAVPIGQIQKIVNMMFSEPVENIAPELFETYISQLTAAIDGLSTEDEPSDDQEAAIEKLINFKAKLEKRFAEKKKEVA